MLLVIICIPLIAGAVIGALYLIADNKVVIRDGYNQQIETGGELEAKYLANGEYAAKKYTFKEEDPIKKVSVFYPEELEKRMAVIL